MIAILLVLCLLGGAAAGYFYGRGNKAGYGEAGIIGGADEPTEILVTDGETGTQAVEPEALPAEPETAAEAPAEQADAEAELPELKLLDYEKLFHSHELDEVVGRVGDWDVNWGEYCYMLMQATSQVENHFLQLYNYYGMNSSWSDAVPDGEGETYAQLAVENAEQNLRFFASIRQNAEENGVTLSEESLASLETKLQQDIANTCGEDATEEDFNDYLGSIFLTRELYDEMNEISLLYQEGFIQEYGVNGEKQDEETALKWLQDNEYLSCTHILLMTVDPSSLEELDEAAAAEKQAKAEELAKELQAIEDPEQRLARFRELKEELCEDTGKTVYPNGYTFKPGTMVPEFEDTTLAMKEYQVSDPVKSDYGWHVIMRLPLDPDAVIDFSSGGLPMTGRSYSANETYAAEMQQRLDTLALDYADGFEVPDLTAFVEE